MKSMEQRNERRFWRYLMVFYFYLLGNNFIGGFESNTQSWDSMIVFISMSVIILLLLFILRFVFRFLFKIPRTMPATIIIVLTISFTFGLLYTLSQYIFYLYVYNIPDQLISFLKLAFTTGQWTFLFFSLAYLGINYWLNLEVERERSRNATNLAQKAQLQMLRYQLNPHFLFNSLTSIQALVHENPDRADIMVTELSDFLRFTLQYNDRITITVREEINITEKYLAIEKIRFEERLDYSIKFDNAILKAEIPCFITQPLVENAVKFGLQKNPKGIKIRMNLFQSDENLIIEVSNTGKLIDGWSMGIGLQNINERLNNAYPGDYKFDLDEAEGFVISRILIRKKAAI